jgi:hypothetical protein
MMPGLGGNAKRMAHWQAMSRQISITDVESFQCLLAWQMLKQPHKATLSIDQLDRQHFTHESLRYARCMPSITTLCIDLISCFHILG